MTQDKIDSLYANWSYKNSELKYGVYAGWVAQVDKRCLMRHAAAIFCNIISQHDSLQHGNIFLGVHVW